ncbi:ATP-dependent Clp protease ATP-binding subunit [Allosaccharopolyspora coralli]|uniref:ATP-dependent Clp protease ATP-binding subunit n=2 Tax=Allosaccharopolyspora coralli TaxID=2665642 RepID=A0A5Q3QCW5_9PSEU|nr:ATP-dependent Clp protease ATP-binding subunit [Allosaccharopolyspora coralli]
MTGTVRLDTLINGIEESTTGVLDRLGNAVLAADHLGELADHLVGHFVDQARRAGVSWTDIGAGLGVSKQAAQKRFHIKGGSDDPGPEEGGFHRFTPRARNVVVAAQNEARASGHGTIAAEHLVLGLLAEPESMAVKVLADEGVAPERLRSAALDALPEGQGQPPELVPFSSQAKKALELTVREALRIGHNFVGTEHVLLALLELEDGSGVLAASGARKEAIESRIVAAIPGIGTT